MQREFLVEVLFERVTAGIDFGLVLLAQLTPGKAAETESRARG
ncbi:hypothetical protein [Archangium violaceum]